MNASRQDWKLYVMTTAQGLDEALAKTSRDDYKRFEPAARN
jgi:hypothetical protein